MKKVCARCDTEKTFDEFHTRGPLREGEFAGYCKQCSSDLSRARSKALKIAAFEKYGGVRCVCCGITEEVFLALDHENNDGAKHRREMGGSGTRMYRWLKAHDYPNLNLKVRCHNCNIGRHINGVCPHQISVGR
jgi:hypothetical protein